MDKKEIKKQIRDAAKKAGIHIRRWQLNEIADMIIMCGGARELKEKIEQFNSTREYIGTKIVNAAPALRIDDGEGNVRIELLADKPITLPTDTVDAGYKVIYPDGYESWSPLDVFEAAYRPTDGMNFGLALEAAKKGARIARRGWNGKGMFLYYVPAAAYPPSTDVAKVAFGGENVPYGAYIAMKTAQGNVVPWLASQTDMLTDDWYIV